jgi:hypothetical protein
VRLRGPLHRRAGVVAASLAYVVKVLRGRHQPRFDELAPLAPDRYVIVVFMPGRAGLSERPRA